jgi:hypothetical protein
VRWGVATTDHHAKRFDTQNILMKYENRRYNKNETSKEFYLRRTKEMEDYFANPYYKIYEKKTWDEYKNAQIR